MRVPENWLRSFVDIKIKTSELAHLLTMSGLEVESCYDKSLTFDRYVRKCNVQYIYLLYMIKCDVNYIYYIDI